MEYKVMLYIVALNVTLSFLHWGLSQIKGKTKTQLDDKLDVVVTFLLTMLEWVMASRRNK
jgi:hypothetical protein